MTDCKVDDQTLNSLVKLGVQGYFPLFHSSWIKEVSYNSKYHFSSEERTKIKKIVSTLSKHKKWSRKETVLLSLPEQERKLFIQSLLTLVEGQILDKKPDLH